MSLNNIYVFYLKQQYFEIIFRDCLGCRLGLDQQDYFHLCNRDITENLTTLERALYDIRDLHYIPEQEFHLLLNELNNNPNKLIERLYEI